MRNPLFESLSLGAVPAHSFSTAVFPVSYPYEIRMANDNCNPSSNTDFASEFQLRSAFFFIHIPTAEIIL